MPFRALDTTAIARSLSQIADRAGDLADAYFERSELVELPPADEVAGVRVWREQGFALRLIRQGAVWQASRDDIDSALFADALRQVARVIPAAPYSPPELPLGSWESTAVSDNLQRFPRRVTRAIRRHLAAFPLRLRLRQHRRWLRVVGTHVAPEQQREEYFSYTAETPWGEHGGLLAQLDDEAAETVSQRLTALFRARQAPAVKRGRYPVILGSDACAVLLHEAVAHALETDTLATGGPPEAALGVQVGSQLLDVLDTPGGGPAAVARSTDDEGVQVLRRWLLRGGVVEQLLADQAAAHDSSTLIAGAGRRQSRHGPPVPRSTHLELLAGDLSEAELLSAIPRGLYFAEAARGRLDPQSGEFTLRFPWGRQLRDGELGEPVAPCGLVGRVSELLSAVSGVGRSRSSAGAGWCAKGGVLLPVWATTPAIMLDSVEVVP